MALKRVFVAVSVTDEAAHRLEAILRGLDIPGRVASPRNWHLTLRFIGDVDDVTLDRISAALDETDLVEPFDVRWGGLGAFPNPTKATVLWLDVVGGREPLDQLARAVDGALERAGVPIRDRPFVPHLTLSRMRPPRDVRPLVDSVEPVGGRMRVDSVELYESHTGRGGTRYEMLDTFELG